MHHACAHTAWPSFAALQQELMSEIGGAHADLHAESADIHSLKKGREEGACEAPYVGWDELEEHGCLARHKVCIDQVGSYFHNLALLKRVVTTQQHCT